MCPVFFGRVGQLQGNLVVLKTGSWKRHKILIFLQEEVSCALSSMALLCVLGGKPKVVLSVVVVARGAMNAIVQWRREGVEPLR